MKKTIYSVALTLAAGIFASCGTSVPKASLKEATKADTLSYAIGVSQSQGLKDYLVARMDMDTTYMNQFVNGVLEGVDANEKKSAYYCGLQIGQQEANQIFSSITSDLMQGKSGELSKKKYVEGFVAGASEKNLKMEPSVAQETAMRLMQVIKESNDSTANLSAELDTFSYAMGVARTQGLKDYVIFRMGVDSAYYATEFIKGVKDGANASENAKKGAFTTGIQIGQQVANQIIPSIASDVFGENADKFNKDFFLAGFIAGTTGKGLLMHPMMAQQDAMRLIEELKNERFESEFGDNKAQGEAFLDSIAKTEGVVKTESGLCYKVITEGKGAIPTNTDKVKVHYRGTLIDGTEFDSSYSRNEPTTFGANQVIAGWTEALTLMPVGSKWMLYIPQNLAYGSRDMGQIKPFSTLVFEVELLEIVK